MDDDDKTTQHPPKEASRRDVLMATAGVMVAPAMIGDCQSESGEPQDGERVESSSAHRDRDALVQRSQAAGVVSILDFGAESHQWGQSGLTDQSPAIQEAIDFAISQDLPIYCPAGRYYLENPVFIAFGKSVTMVGDYSSNTTRGTLFVTRSSGPVVVAQTPTSFHGMGFVYDGEPLTNDAVAIRCLASRNADDMDCAIESCTFRFLGTGIDAYGRGLKVTNCRFGKVRRCIVRSWEVANQEFPPGNNHTDLPFGYRADTITDNRFHALGTDGIAIDVREDAGTGFFRSAIIANNMIDLKGLLFRGAANNCLFSANVVSINDNSSTQSAVIDFVGPSEHNVIVGNSFSGFVNRNSVPTIVANRAIMFRSDCTHTTIAANSFQGFTRAAIIWVGNTRADESDPGPGSLRSHIAVTGNSFSHCEHALLGGSIYNLVESGNTFHECVRRVGFDRIRGPASHVQSERAAYSDDGTVLENRDADGFLRFGIAQRNAGAPSIALECGGRSLALDCADVRPATTAGDIPLGNRARPFKEAHCERGYLAPSPDGRWYRLAPPNGGGPARWEEV